jgi:integrase
MKNKRGIFEKTPGSGEFWIRFADAAGRIRREKVGTREEAEARLKLRKEEAKLGALPRLAWRRRPVLFERLIEDAIAYVKGRYSRPADDVARLELLKERLGDRAADRTTPGEVQRALDRLACEKRWSASTRNKHHNLISLAYRLGVLHGKVEKNPLHGLRRATENNSRVRFLTFEEEGKLREVIRSRSEWAEHEPELDLALHTGLRRGSMYRDLVWENVDLAARVALIPRTKNGEPVVVPLNDIALRALAVFRARGDGRGRVVRNALGETLNVNAHWFPAAVRAAGIKDFRWHDLRHTYASRLRQAGVPLGNIAELLGHKGLTMTRRYAHLSIPNLHEAVSVLTKTDTKLAPAPEAEKLATSLVQ